MSKKIYFSEFANTLKWWDDEEERWRIISEHPDGSSMEPKDNWVWVWDGELPDEAS